MSTLSVLALDPGDKTGWAVGTVDPDHYQPIFPDELSAVTAGDLGDTIQTMPVLTVEKHGISHLKDMALACHKAIVLEDRYDVVIYETWRLAKGKAMAMSGSDFQPSQFIGMVRLCCWLNPRVKVVAQPPKAKATADKILPKLYPEIQDLIDKAPKAHDESHDTDALRHLAKWHWDTYVGKETTR